jgi:hypothetical protein
MGAVDEPIQVRTSPAQVNSERRPEAAGQRLDGPQRDAIELPELDP